MADTLLQFVLDFLDRFDSPVILHSDTAAYPREDLDDLVSSGILRETARATRIPRPARLGPGPDLLVRETARDLYGVAEEDDYFDPVTLTPEEVRQYEVCLPRLVDRVRKENGISGSGFENVAGLIPLGAKLIGETVPVWSYLSLSNGDEGAVLARCARLNAPGSRQNALLVVPNGPAFSPEARRVLGDVGVLSLWEAARRGTLTLHWTSVLTSSRLSGTSAARVFRLDGQIWTLEFEGKTVRLPGTRGLFYICHLLRSPGRLVPAVELIRAVPTAPKLGSASLGSAAPILDDTAISQYKHRLSVLGSEITEATRGNDLGRKEILETEREQILSQIQSATGLGGRRRSTGETEKVRKSVSNAISRAITSIRRYHRSLADHLQRFIDRGQDLSYTGDGIPWNF